MFIYLNKIAWLIVPVCFAAAVSAQETIDRPSQKSKDAVDKLKATPSVVGKTLQAIGSTVSGKLGLGGGEIKTAKVSTEAAQVPPAEKQNDEAQPPSAPVLGKRDPFRPFTLNIKTSGRRSTEKLSPLERYELGQLKLVGVIWDVKQPNAIVEDAAGLGYVVRTGTAIGSNEGKVKKIQPAGLVIEEFETDVFGTRRKIERTMRLATEKAE
jgi:Tfp pilus assembly protein PilP